MGIGILSPEEVLALNPAGAAAHAIVRPSGAAPEDLVKESALDLPLGDTYWVMKGSCRTHAGMSVSDLIRLFSVNPEPTEVEDELELQTNSVYLFEADCKLNLAGTSTQGKATARSSIGRLDVLVRLLCDGVSEFDRVPPNHQGLLYIEVTPITFKLTVRPGTCLSQLRLFRGTDRLVNITKEEFEYESEFPLANQPPRFATDDPHEVWHPFRLELEPDPAPGCSGFVAKNGAPGPIDPDKRDHYDPQEFWDPVPAKDDAIALETDRLYILRSKEHLRMPGHIALECEAYTETMGEWRIEYAGFAHPWFGHSREHGSPLIFEVRGHNIPTILTDGIPLGNVCFKRMSQRVPPPAPRNYGQYEKQELKLSGCFKDWPTQKS